jgi:hypothetical protein
MIHLADFHAWRVEDSACQRVRQGDAAERGRQIDVVGGGRLHGREPAFRSDWSQAYFLPIQLIIARSALSTTFDHRGPCTTYEDKHSVVAIYRPRIPARILSTSRLVKLPLIFADVVMGDLTVGAITTSPSIGMASGLESSRTRESAHRRERALSMRGRGFVGVRGSVDC